MSKFFICTFAAILALLTAQSVDAQTIFHASLTHDQEVAVPPIPDEGSKGYAVLILNAAQNQLSYHIVTTGLDLDGNQTLGTQNDNVTRLHFHRAPAGTNGGIVFGMIDPTPTLRNDLDDLKVIPSAGTVSGIWDGAEGNGTTLAAELANLMNGNLYLNFHTFDHGGGEIRGQIRPIPEPSTVALGGLAVVGGICAALRRRRAACA